MALPSRLGLWLLCLASVACGPAAAHAARPRPDPEAMREAVAQSREVRYASSRAYAHFMQAMLALAGEDLAKAIEELRLAVLFDPESPYLRVALAEALGRTGAWVKAQAELEEALRLDPGHVPAWLESGRQWAERQRPKEAQKAFEHAIARAPQDPQAYLLLAQVHLDAGDDAKAIAVIEAFGRAMPGDPRGFKALGRHFAQRNEAAQAVPLLRRAERLDPSDAETARLLARALEQSGDGGEAVRFYERALTQDPDDAESLLALGALLLRRGETAAARAWLDQLMAVRPDDADVRAQVALAYFKAHRLAEACEHFAHARALAPEDGALAFFHGRILAERGLWAQAAEAFAAVGEESALRPQALVHQVRALSAAGEHGRALALAQRTLAAAPATPSHQVALAEALEAAGRAEEAAAHLEKALAQGGGRVPELLFALGTLLERRGDLDGAVARMRQVLEQEPNHADALNFIGYTLAEQGRSLEEAEGLVRRALAAEPDNGAYLDSLGWVLFKRGALQPALGALEQARALLPDEPLVAEHLGDVYQALSRRGEAAEAYRGAMEAMARAPGWSLPAVGRDRSSPCERLQTKLSAVGGPKAPACGKLTTPGKRP